MYKINEFLYQTYLIRIKSIYFEVKSIFNYKIELICCKINWFFCQINLKCI